MTKKATKSPSSRNNDLIEAPGETMTWMATNLLDTRFSHQSDIKSEKLEEVRLLFPSSANIIIPNSIVRADSYKKDWVSFYYYPFDIGLSFPFSPFVAEVLKTLNVSPGQLMPFAWRTLACLDAIEAKHHLGINVEVVKHSYGLKKFSGCRVGFVNRNTEDPLILNNDTMNDWNWKKSYFFVDKKSLGGVGDYLVDRWTQSELEFECDENDDKAGGVVGKISELPIGERLWPNCLNRPIRNSSRVKFDDFVARSGKFLVRQEVGVGEKLVQRSDASTTRSKQLVTPVTKGSQSVQDFSYESQDSPQEAKDVEMSPGRRYAKEFKPPTIKPFIIPIKELFAKRARVDKSTETDSSKAPLTFSPSSSPSSMKVKISPSTSVVKSDSLMPLAAHGYYVGAKPSVFAHLLNDMLLPQSMEALSARPFEAILDDSAGYAFHALQSVMVAREVYEHEMEGLRKVENEHKACTARIRVVEELNSKLLKARNDIQGELDDFAAKVQSLESNMRIEAEKAVHQQIMRTRVNMMLEYHRGEWRSWDIAETVKIYNEAFPDDAFPLDELDTNDVEAKSPKGSAQNED